MATVAGPLIYVNATEHDFRSAGSELMKRNPEGRSRRTFKRRWMSLFGVSIPTCVSVWTRLSIATNDPDFNGVKPCHLLWALMFLKIYGSEEEMAALCGGIDEQTYRHWSHLLANRISNLLTDLIEWENRKVGDIGNDCLVSIDCTDCMVSKIGSGLFRSFKTHKFKQPGLRYEIGLCIITGCIVSVMGPFPCGDWPDINIFRYHLLHMLDPFERVEADDGYIGEDPVNAKVPRSMVHDQRQVFLKMRSYVRRRHETVNKRMKQFKVLSTVFRGDIMYHGTCFRAVAVLTQLEIENGARLFDVTYTDDYFEAFQAYG